MVTRHRQPKHRTAGKDNFGNKMSLQAVWHRSHVASTVGLSVAVILIYRWLCVSLETEYSDRLTSFLEPLLLPYSLC